MPSRNHLSGLLSIIDVAAYIVFGWKLNKNEQFESLLQYDKEIYRLPTKLPIYLSPMRSGSSKSFKSPKFGSALNSEQLTNFTSIHLTS